MGSYYAHKRREKVEVPYSFQCEHCGQDSGILSAVIAGAEAETPSYMKTISAEREKKLCMKAHKYLVREIKSIHRKTEEKKIFPNNFSGQCPHCKKKQSWTVSGLMEDRFVNSIVALGLGVFFGGFVVLGHFLDAEEELFSFPLAAVIFAVSVLAAIGLYVWNMMKINREKRETASGRENVPVIYWDSVQQLLNEQ